MSKIFGKIISYLSMKKQGIHTPTMSGNLYLYKDYYGDLYLAYSKYSKRCKIDK